MMMRTYFECVWECEHRRVTARAEVDDGVATMPPMPVCQDCGPFTMPRPADKSSRFYTRFVTSDHPLRSALHESFESFEEKSS